MNRTSLLPAVVRMLTLSTIPPLTYFGVTQYNELNKVELPELPIAEEVEPEAVPQETTTQRRTRKVGKQTKGKSLTDGFGASYSSYNYSAKTLSVHCKKPYQIFRNGCAQADFSEVEEEISG